MTKLRMTQKDLELIYLEDLYDELTLTQARKILRRWERKFKDDPVFRYMDGIDGELSFPCTDEQWIWYEDLETKIQGLRNFIQEKREKKAREVQSLYFVF